MKGAPEPLETHVAPPGRKTLVVPALLCLLFFLNGLNDAVRNSAVADEVGGHMAAGYLYWSSGKYSGGGANFPLAHLLIALPVVLLGYSFELFTEQHLLLFRLPVLSMGLLLGIVLYRFTAELFDRKAALAALFLFSLSPNVLAHASLATLDVPIAFFVFLTIYALWRYVQRPHWARMLALSFALACALTTKVQAILLIPIILLVLLVPRRLLPSCSRPVAIPHWSWLFLLIVPPVFINLIYLNSPLHSGDLYPPLYVAALETKLLHGAYNPYGLQSAYLWGQYSLEGWWYYFPFAILVKTPLPTLVLLGLGILGRHTRKSLLFVALPLIVFLGTAMAASLNIGLRHVLLIYPFLFMLAGQGATSWWNRSWRGVVLAGLGAGYLLQAAVIAPHHLSYFNVLVGGPRNGHKFLIGSNYDSGQNDHFLRRYIKDRGIAYQINPDAFHPTTGHIMVKANALYGGYGHGGPAAYAWLKRFEPVNQVAYTWFEYYIPEDAHPGAAGTEYSDARVPDNLFYPWNPKVDVQQRNTLLDQIELYLRALRQRYREITHPQVHHTFAMAFIATAAYESALDELRLVLKQRPDLRRALGWGGDLMVRWKVGILNFEGDEYLTGFHPATLTDDAAIPDPAPIARAARRLGIEAQVSEAHLVLGFALERRGRIDVAIEQYQAALRIAPTHLRAQRRLTAIRAKRRDD